MIYIFLFLTEHNPSFTLFLICSYFFPVDTGRKLNVYETFKRRSRRLLNVLLCTFNLRPGSTGLPNLRFDVLIKCVLIKTEFIKRLIINP